MDPNDINISAVECEFRSRLGAYHDGELAPADAGAVEEHLKQCEPCRAELEEIRELSVLARQIGTEGVSPFGMQRIHRAIDREGESAIPLLRIAGILSGLAASVMVISAAWLWETPAKSNPGDHRAVIINNQSNWQNVAIDQRFSPTIPVRHDFQVPERIYANQDQRFSAWMVEELRRTP